MTDILKKICLDKSKEIEILQNKCSLNTLKKLVSDKIEKRDFKNTAGKSGNFQKNFNVYERKGLNCKRPGCNGIIKKKMISNRSSFFCNICQI